jgi:hypothetical protein
VTLPNHEKYPGLLDDEPVGSAASAQDSRVGMEVLTALSLRLNGRAMNTVLASAHIQMTQ